MTLDQLLDHFKTQAAIAEFFDISEPAVSRWFKDGVVPDGRQYELQVKTAGKLMATCGGKSNETQ